MSSYRVASVIALSILITGLPAVPSAHGVSSRDGRFLQSLDGAAVAPLMYLGAKHMVTGYEGLRQIHADDRTLLDHGIEMFETLARGILTG